MKKTVLMSMSILMVLSASSAFAATRQAEVRKTFESKVKEGQKQMQAGKGEQIRVEVVKDLSALTGGRVGTREMNAALNKTFKLNDGGTEVEVNLLALAQAVRDAKEVTSQINRNELDAEAKDLMAQKDRALEIIPKFLALASIVSKSTPAKQKEIDAFVKQLSLTTEMLTTMDKEELKSHLDVMELAVENKLRNPELEGDQANAQALKTKFGSKYAEKLEEILGCQRG